VPPLRPRNRPSTPAKHPFALPDGLQRQLARAQAKWRPRSQALRPTGMSFPACMRCGRPDRVRPPLRDCPGQRCAVTSAHPYRRAHAQRQRLWEGFSAPGLRAIRPCASVYHASARPTLRSDISPAVAGDIAHDGGRQRRRGWGPASHHGVRALGGPREPFGAYARQPVGGDRPR
jgi:hypothetical protein